MTDLIVKRSPLDDGTLGSAATELDLVGSDVRRLLDDETGEVVAVLGSLPARSRTALRRATLGFPRSTISRGRGIRNQATSFGYLAAHQVLRRASCRSCNAAEQVPEHHAVVCDAAADLAAVMAELLPERTERDAACASVISDEWRLAGSPWTGGVVNFDAPLPYHKDANNLPVWSAMVGFRRGVRGGYLSLPEYGVSLPIRDGDVLFFAGWDIVHGVTPLTRVQPDGYRITIVYYSVSRMQHCDPASDALAKGRAARTHNEDHWRERQMAAGLLDEG